LSVTIDDIGVRAHCHHCGISAVQTFGFREDSVSQPHPFAPRQEERFTTSDRLDDHRPLDERAIAFLAERGISKETAELYGCIAGTRRYRERQGIPGGTMDSIGFPYADAGRSYAIKWRSCEAKNFTQDGSAQTLWGPEQREGDPLVICEGEVDALSVCQATGIRAKSIPSGAAENISPSTRLQFLERSFEEVKSASKVILFLDDDPAGRAMTPELARRVGRAKVWTVKLPDGCKDANDVLRFHGEDGLRKVVEAAEPWPIEGLVRAGDIRARIMSLHRDGLPPGRSTGWPSVDKHLTIQTGMLYIVTGRPGAGKSAWLDNLMVNISDRLDWAWAVASFESPIELNVSRLVSLRTGTPFRDLLEEVVEKQIAWIDQHFHFLTSEGIATTESIIERAQVAVLRYGIRALVIDPYNYVRNSDGEMDTEGVNRLLSALKVFAVANDVAVFLVAHPAKPGFQSPVDWMPGGYDISGSANFFNRADFGVTIGRTEGCGEMEGDAQVMVWKAKWSHLGKEGRVLLLFDPLTEKFSEIPTPVYGGWDDYHREGDGWRGPD
jgi:twinkle protein